MILDNKIIIILGGAGFIGQAFVKGLCKHGANVIVGDFEQKNMDDAKNNFLKEGLNVDFLKVDITDDASLQNIISFTQAKYGFIDALVNTAYPRTKDYGKKLEDISYKIFCENVDVHLGGFFLATKIFSLFFRKQQRGNIVNISSIYGIIPPRFEIYNKTEMSFPVEYIAIKSAIIHLTKYFAKYLKNTGVRINTISPGGILNNQPTEFLEKYNAFGLSKGMLNRNDVVGTLVFLLSDLSEYINGQNIIVDDGWSL